MPMLTVAADHREDKLQAMSNPGYYYQNLNFVKDFGKTWSASCFMWLKKDTNSLLIYGEQLASTM